MLLNDDLIISCYFQKTKLRIFANFKHSMILDALTLVNFQKMLVFTTRCMETNEPNENYSIFYCKFLCFIAEQSVFFSILAYFR